MADHSRTSEENLAIQAKLDAAAARKNMINNFVPYLGLAFTLIFFTAVTGGKFLSSANLVNLVEQCLTLVLVAVGAAFVYAQGNMDFSIGSACGLAQMVGGIFLLKFGAPIGVVIAVIIVIPIISCLCVALIAVIFKVPVFIGSMCIRSLLAGLLSIGVSRSEMVIPISNYPYLQNNIVKAIVLVVIIALGAYLFNVTRIGKWAKLIGGNQITAKQAGVRVTLQAFLAYVLLGACVGIAAVFSCFRSGRITAASGSGIEFNMMLAIVLGGFPMSGGDKAKFSAAIIGAITACLLTNGLGVWGLDPNLIGGVKGIIFIVIIALTYDRSAGKLVN